MIPGGNGSAAGGSQQPSPLPSPKQPGDADSSGFEPQQRRTTTNTHYDPQFVMSISVPQQRRFILSKRARCLICVSLGCAGVALFLRSEGRCCAAKRACALTFLVARAFAQARAGSRWS
jgi:hypothetical protein